MISDTLHDAIHEIEQYQRQCRGYDDIAEDIETVKKVMSALQERLDYPFEYPLGIMESLSPEEKERWRVICEGNIARWVGRLRLLGAVSNEELVVTLGDAIQRQETLLDEESKNETWDVERDNEFETEL